MKRSFPNFAMSHFTYQFRTNICLFVMDTSKTNMPYQMNTFNVEMHSSVSAREQVSTYFETVQPLIWNHEIFNLQFNLIITEWNTCKLNPGLRLPDDGKVCVYFCSRLMLNKTMVPLPM